MPLNSSVNNALCILEALFRESSPMTITEISTRIGVTRSTAYSLVETLLAHSLLARTLDGKYFLSYGCFQLGLGYRSQFRDYYPCNAPMVAFLLQKPRPWLLTCCLMVLQADKTIFACIENYDQARLDTSFFPTVQHRRIRPWYTCAGGKLLLAYHTPAEQEEYIRQIPVSPLNEELIKALPRQLEKAAFENHLVDTSDYYRIGETSTAAPVFNHSGKVTATIHFQITPGFYYANARDIIDTTKELGATLSRAMGYSPVL